eukprot:8795305-Pyramimonas_sp.AAC.2
MSTTLPNLGWWCTAASTRGVGLDRKTSKLKAGVPSASVSPYSDVTFGFNAKQRKDPHGLVRYANSPRTIQKASRVVVCSSASSSQMDASSRGFHQDRLRSSASENLPKAHDVVVR